LEALSIILFTLIGWYGYDAIQAKEAAIAAARRACARHQQQLLDETVVLARLRPRRDRSGRVRWWRRYRFEFSEDGEQRRGGELTMLGRRVTGLSLALDDHTLYDQDEGGHPPYGH
jgi:hypothetical protein